MSFANPTALRIGMEGPLLQKRYHVAGRVVLGTEEGGQTYYWQEFNLIDADGESATLVFETTDAGDAWRLFTYFEPEYAISAEDAATKRVGDRLNLEGTDVQITSLGRSRVYHLEGEAPEGVEVGDQARYFNAESGDVRIVVSWTGAEVECFRGEDLSEDTVRSAFNLRAMKAEGWTPGRGKQATPIPTAVWLTGVGVFLAVALIFAGWWVWRPKPLNPAVALPAPQLSGNLGQTWKVRGMVYQLREHAVVEIATVDARYQQHEFHLADPQSVQPPLFLVYGSKPGARDWVLYTALQPTESLTSAQAAAKRLGDRVNIDGELVRVASLFQTILRRSEGAEATEPKPETLGYGLSGESGTHRFLIRWNTTAISFFRGTALAAKEVEKSGRGS